MREFIEKIPWPVEFLVVIAVAFGPAIVDSTALALHPHTGTIHTVSSLWETAAKEALVLVVLGLVLRLRGWNLSRLGMQSEWVDGLHGLGLAGVCYLTFIAAFTALKVFAPHLAEAASKLQVLPGHLPALMIATVPAVNAIFEEVFVAGYVITILKEKTSETVAINVSVALRLSYHLYQGAAAVVSIIPVGLIFAYWYARTGKLWPLIVAHTLIDVIGFLAS